LYLLFKPKSKYLVSVFILVVLILLSFKDVFKDIIFFFSTKIYTYSESNYKQKFSQLRKENIALKLQIKNHKSSQTEIKTLKKAFDLETKENIDLIGAEIMFFSPSTLHHVTFVNKGKNSGLKEGQFAIDADGNLIGRIREVKEKFSEIILIDDPDFTVPVYVGQNELGLLQGNLFGAKILYIEPESKIAAKEKVWVKAYPYSFSLHIGKIKKVRQSKNGLFLQIDVELAKKNNLQSTIFIIK